MARRVHACALDTYASMDSPGLLSLALMSASSSGLSRAASWETT